MLIIVRQKVAALSDVFVFRWLHFEKTILSLRTALLLVLLTQVSDRSVRIAKSSRRSSSLLSFFQPCVRPLKTGTKVSFSFLLNLGMNSRYQFQ